MLRRGQILTILGTSLVLLLACSKTGKVTRMEKNNLVLNEQSAADPTTLELIKPYSEPLEKEMNEVLVNSKFPAVKGDPESAMGNLVSDIILKRGNILYRTVFNDSIDFCLLNKGGLRTQWPAGNITTGMVFELMPFENEMVVLTLSGKKTAELFRYVAYVKGMPMAGVKMGIRDTLPSTILINGKAFDPERNYKVVTSDYLAAGGDKMRFFNSPLKADTLHLKLRDAIINELRETGRAGRSIEPLKDGRLYLE